MFKPTKKQHLVNKAYSDKNGGSGGGGTLDHTWQEIVDAQMAWLEKTLGTRTTREPLSGITADEGTGYSVVFDGMEYKTTSPNGYPAVKDIT